MSVDTSPASPTNVAPQAVTHHSAAVVRMSIAAAIRNIYEVAVNSRDEGRHAAVTLLNATPRPTALLAMSDELALGALAAARELDLRVPDDVSIVGWDDSVSAHLSDPPLATLYQSPLHDQGRTCARLLIAATHGEITDDDLVHLAPSHLVIRESTGPPAAS